jgi:small subunit ribosomal protein S20
MANIKSQKKRILTDEKRRVRNVAVRTRVKTYVKQAEDAIKEKDVEKIAVATKKAVTEIDRAAKNGVFHANSAARQKGSLQRQANAATAS